MYLQQKNHCNIAAALWAFPVVYPALTEDCNKCQIFEGFFLPATGQSKMTQTNVTLSIATTFKAAYVLSPTEY